MNLSIGYITARENNCFDWFLSSLRKQVKPEDEIEIVIVNSNDGFGKVAITAGNITIIEHPPKPTVWSGPDRLTKSNWWSKANSLNTFFCLAKHAWVCCVDDRSVLMPGWLDGIRFAMDQGVATCGSYEKRIEMTVDDGVIIHGGTIIGKDSRRGYVESNGFKIPWRCPGEWMFGCCFSLPLEWALNINGAEELMDGLSAEDVVFGKNLENNGYPIVFDPRMLMIEDRTASELGVAPKRSSKERHPNDKNDKGHAALARFMGQKRTQHQWDLRKIREDIAAGKPFPKATGPTTDWFDGQPLSEFE